MDLDLPSTEIDLALGPGMLVHLSYIVNTGLGHFIMLQLAAEIAESGLEAMTFGVLMTNWTMSTVLSSVIGNILSVPFGVIG